MWWHSRTTLARLCGPAGALALAALLAGCFEPMYGQKTLDGGPGLRQRLASVAVERINVPNGTPQARIATEIQRDLAFDLTGGGDQVGKTHTLRINMTAQNQQVIVDITTARADVQQFGLDVTYTLVENATGKPVVQGQTFARVAYDNPGQMQRFANARGQRDAENRAAQVIAANIKARLASYFSAGA